MEGDASDVASVAFEGEDCGGVCGFDVVQLNCVVTGGGQESFVR